MQPISRQPNSWTTERKMLSALGAIIALGVPACCCGFVFTSCATGAQSGADLVDVRLSNCKVTEGFLAVGSVDYMVTNNDSRAHTVELQIEYRDSAGFRLDLDAATVEDLAPGGKVRGHETTVLDAGAPSGACVLTSVNVS